MSVTPSISSDSSMTTWARNAPLGLVRAHQIGDELDDQRAGEHDDEADDQQQQRARRASEEDVTRAAHDDCNRRDRGIPITNGHRPVLHSAAASAAHERVGGEAQRSWISAISSTENTTQASASAVMLSAPRIRRCQA